MSEAKAQRGKVTVICTQVVQRGPDRARAGVRAREGFCDRRHLWREDPTSPSRSAEGCARIFSSGPRNSPDRSSRKAVSTASSRTAFAHSSAAFAVKAGTPKPDISSPQKLKEALLAAKAVCYSGGASGIHFVQACEKLGIADVVAAKLVKPRPGEMVGPVLVRGEADIGVQQPAELLPVAGIEIIGPLPRRAPADDRVWRDRVHRLDAARRQSGVRRLHALGGRARSACTTRASTRFRGFLPNAPHAVRRMRHEGRWAKTPTLLSASPWRR